MNWDDVRLFLAVARAGQILGAARRLGLNHATVGRRLDQLETALKTKLLDRRPSGCTLTPDGAGFLLAAERMEAEMQGARSALGGEGAGLSGTVRIGAPDGFGTAFLAPRLGLVAARHPGLTIQLVPVPRAFSLSRREADIAITVERPEQGRLVAQKLVDYALGLYASSAYLDAHGRPVDMADLGGHRLVGHVDDLLYSPSLDYAAEILGDRPSRIEISSALGQTEAVAAGAGIGILHRFIAARRPELERVLPAREIRRAYWLVYHESARGLPRIAAVAAAIRDLVEAEREIFL
ncbi:LysR family transcriptional regulator [Aureimonas glaciei]|uniref:Transcriptional regulator n=1 Tax=Aureimonas glaciei TaxID=1776957 RepID=A0A916XSY4_9HYPH|nr:LysR family transcriptional regulator [Aureimonas glaciei]GGD04768.1 transcriptional regulator [Aureimonas glaciei]